MDVRKKWSNGVWNAKDGTVLLISDMADSHLLNTIHLLLRTGGSYWLYYSTLLPEARYRGLWTDAEKLEWRLKGIDGMLWKLIK